MCILQLLIYIIIIIIETELFNELETCHLGYAD